MEEKENLETTEQVKSPEEVLAELQEKVANEMVNKSEAEMWKQKYYKSFQDKANGISTQPDVAKVDPAKESEEFWNNMNRLGTLKVGKGKPASEHLSLLLKIRDYNLKQGKEDIFPDNGEAMAAMIRDALESSEGDEKLLATTIQSKIKFSK